MILREHVFDLDTPFVLLGLQEARRQQRGKRSRRRPGGSSLGSTDAALEELVKVSLEDKPLTDIVVNTAAQVNLFDIASTSGRTTVFASRLWRKSWTPQAHLGSRRVLPPS